MNTYRDRERQRKVYKEIERKEVREGGRERVYRERSGREGRGKGVQREAERKIGKFSTSCMYFRIYEYFIYLKTKLIYSKTFSLTRAFLFYFYLFSWGCRKTFANLMRGNKKFEISVFPLNQLPNYCGHFRKTKEFPYELTMSLVYFLRNGTF